MTVRVYLSSRWTKNWPDGGGPFQDWGPTPQTESDSSSPT